MIFDEGGAKLVAATRIFNLRSINTQNESCFGFTTRRLFGIASSDFEFGGSARCHKLQKGQSKTFCRLLQRIMGRMSSNKNVELESFLLDPDGSEGMKGLGKGRRNVIVFNCKKVAR